MSHTNPQRANRNQQIRNRNHKERFSGEYSFRKKKVSDKHQFEATEVHSTEKAILLNVEGEEVWFPRAMITWVSKGTYECSISFAKEKGLIE